MQKVKLKKMLRNINWNKNSKNWKVLLKKWNPNPPLFVHQLRLKQNLSKLTNFWSTQLMLSSRNLKSGMLSVYLISMTVFVDDFDDVDDSDVSIDSSSSEAFFCRARATAKRISPCLTLAQWSWVRRTLVRLG